MLTFKKGHFTYSFPDDQRRLVWDGHGNLHPFAEIIAQGCLFVGMRGIMNERAAVEYFWRTTAMCLAGETWGATISLSDVRKCIGLTTTAPPLTRPRFVAQVRRILESRATDIVKRFGGSPFKRIEVSYFGHRGTDE